MHERGDVQAFRTEIAQGAPAIESLWGPDAQRRYGPSTLSTQEVPIAGAVLPRTQGEVERIVALAAKLKVPLYPISVGHNWGYGSKSPASAGCIIVDLSGMDSILDFDPMLGTITVEPGVTTQHVARFLAERRAPFVAPVTGAGSRSSMLGNALDKGISSAPIHDRASSLISLSAVLPDGSVYSSEAGGATYRWGLGPHLDGLFLQHGSGIVTRATFLLDARMRSHRLLVVSADTAQQAQTLIGTLHALSLLLKGVFSSFQLEGPLRTYANFTPRLEERVDARGITSSSAIDARLREVGFGRHNAFISLRGELPLVRAAERIAKGELAREGFKARGYSSASIRRARRLRPLLPPFMRAHPELLNHAQKTINRSTGNNKPFDSRWFPLWRQTASMRDEHDPSAPENIDLEPSGGFMLFVAAITARTPYAPLAEDVEAICASHGMEPMYSAVGMPERYLHFAVQLTYDKQSPEQTERAHACYEALFRLLLSRGGLPYRVPVSMRHLLSEVRPAYWPLAKKIKKALDPDGIMSPGRYEPLE